MSTTTGTPAATSPAAGALLWVLLSSVTVVGVLFIGVYPMRTYLSQRASLHRAERQMDVLKTQNDKLAEQAAATQHRQRDRAPRARAVQPRAAGRAGDRDPAGAAAADPAPAGLAVHRPREEARPRRARRLTPSVLASTTSDTERMRRTPDCRRRQSRPPPRSDADSRSREHMSILGTRVARVEDPRFLTVGGTYVADVKDPLLDGALYATYVRSTMAHATITVDVDEARTTPGVVGRVHERRPRHRPLPPAMPMITDAMSRPMLATDRVRFVGEPVAVILTERPEQGVDAAELVFVDYEPLPAVVEPEQADTDEVLLFPEAGTNCALELAFGRSDDLFDGCEVVVTQRIVNQRVAAAPLETRGAAAAWGDDGRLHFWISTQHAHGAPRRSWPGSTASTRARCTSPRPTSAAASAPRSAPRPRRRCCRGWRGSRAVPCAGTRPAPRTWWAWATAGRRSRPWRSAATRDGTVEAYRLTVLQDAGAYPAVGAVLPFLTRMMTPGVYVMPKVECNSRAVVTNTTPIVAYRGAGRPEAAAAMERAIDLFAAEIGMDAGRGAAPQPAAAVRRARHDAGRHHVRHRRLRRGARPCARRGRLRRAARRTAATARRGRHGAARHRRVGVRRGHRRPDAGQRVRQPRGASGRQRHHLHGRVTARPGPRHELRHDRAGHHRHPDGPRRHRLGRHRPGRPRRGHDGLALAAGRRLGRAAGVRDRDRRGEEDRGRAARGERRRRRARDEQRHVPRHRHARRSSRTWAEVATAAMERDESGAGLCGEIDFHEKSTTFPFGAHVAVVDVDIETGRVDLRRMITCDDAGRIINPLLVEGQRHGGIAQGAAQALLEEIRFDDDGNPITSNFADYGIISAAELPTFELETMETPTPANPLGAKGIGESGAIGATPAVQSAVCDAVAHLGVRHIDIPCTPERVWRAIEAAKADARVVTRRRGRSGA